MLLCGSIITAWAKGPAGLRFLILCLKGLYTIKNNNKIMQSLCRSMSTKYFNILRNANVGSLNAHQSPRPTAIHWDLEQGVVSGHLLRNAGGVASGNQQRRGQRGFREGGRHREDKVAIDSALWERAHIACTHTHTQPQS